MNSGLMLRFLLLIALLLAFLQVNVAQRVIVNGNGERMIIYPDGSWRLVEAGDSLLLRQNLQKSETINYPSSNIDNTVKRNPGEEEEYILKQWNELFFRIKDQGKKAQNQFRTATNAQFKAGELLQNAEQNKAMIESDRLASLHEDYEKAIEKLRTAKLRQKAILKLTDKSKKIAGQSPATIKRKFSQLNVQFENYLSMYDPDHNIQDLSKTRDTQKELATAPSSSKSRSSKKTTKTDTSGRSMERNKHSNPTIESENGIKDEPSASNGTSYLTIARTPTQRLPEGLITRDYKSEDYPCRIAADTIDSSTGTHRIGLKHDLIFTDTDPDLRPYFKSKELITCFGGLSKIGAYVYFTIDIQIASSYSQGNFGSLESGSLLRLRLLNGKYVSLYNLKSDRGHIDHYSGHTIFSGQYALGKDEIKILSSSPLDKIRILWGTGYEDYDVFKIDFFIDQIHCLFSK